MITRSNNAGHIIIVAGVCLPALGDIAYAVLTPFKSREENPERCQALSEEV